MNAKTLFFTGLVSIMLAVRCNADKLATAQEISQAPKSAPLTKAEYLHKAYVLRQGFRPPEDFTGTWRTWYENGNPQSELSLVNGVSHGPCKAWDIQGKLIATGDYRKGDEFAGSFRSGFHWNGHHCYVITSYTSGQRHGSYSEWTVKGQQLIDGHFADDKPAGNWTWWDEKGTTVADGTYKDGRPWNGTIAIRSDDQWHIQEYEDGEDVLLRRMKNMSLAELSQTVTNPVQHESVRWQATRELARRKDPLSKPLLIILLKDDSHSVRGSAAWALCQIGGKDAQDALLAFLNTSLTARNWGDLTRATEAQKELPDARALDLLIKCLHERNGHHKAYAAEALGKIGDPKASLSLAQQLDLNIEYSMSRDYLYLTAIRETKGKDATPLLIDYLERLVTKMTDQNLDDHPIIVGRAPRQMNYNFTIYGLTLAALEAVADRKSSTGTREDVAKDWKKWWKDKSGEPGAAADADKPCQ